MIKIRNKKLPEDFQPIRVSSPVKNPWIFRLRCVVDFQLLTISKYIKPEIKKIKGTCLDVGAGDCPWRGWLSSSVIYTGIDVENSSDFGMRKASDVIYYDGKNIPYNDSVFDNVICIEVLEHTCDPQLLLSEINRVLRKNGTVLLTVPWSARIHHIPYDYHRFTKECLHIIFTKCGFSDIEISERGSDISVIANKLIVLNLRLIKSGFGLFAPIGFLCLPITFIFILFGHLSEYFGVGAKEDPLGYFVKATK